MSDFDFWLVWSVSMGLWGCWGFYLIISQTIGWLRVLDGLFISFDFAMFGFGLHVAYQAFRREKLKDGGA